jgi:predicted HTH transcriptional regulator
MNANELADELDIHVSMGGSNFFKEAATMLRQQQAEIKALKDELKGWNLAWYESNPPHPAETLTDEEIKQIFQEQTGFHFDDNPADDLALMDFARAILRKAQE